MDLTPTPEQEDIAALAAAFLAKELPPSRILQMADEPSNVDATVWSRAAELGWLILGLPVELVGVGYGRPEEVMVFREIGRHLATGPFLATALATRLAARAGRSALAADLGAGRMAGLAVADSAIMGERVTGRFTVVDGDRADLLLVTSPAGSALVEGPDVSGGELMRAVSCIDESTRLSEWDADRVAVLAYLPAETEDLFSRGVLLSAAMLTGIAVATRDSAVEHAKSRVQGGQPIGAYQAIKHPCADMAVRAEAALSQLWFAAAAAEMGRPDAVFQGSAARLVAADAARRNAAANIQIHGGMGFTFEQGAHFYVKRTQVLSQIFGSPSFHLAAALEHAPAK